MNTGKKTMDLAHKTCLAGVGVLDSGREKAANKFDQLFVEGSALIIDLLEKGESLETQFQAKIEAPKMLKDKISAFVAKLGFTNEKHEQQIETLTQRVDSLVDVVAKLAQQNAAEKKVTPESSTIKPEAKAAAKKAPAKTATKSAEKPAAKVAATKSSAKPAAKPAAKAAAKKAPAKTAAKPAAKSTATKSPAKTATKPATKSTTKKASAKTSAKPDNKDTESKAPTKTEAKPDVDDKK